MTSSSSSQLILSSSTSISPLPSSLIRDINYAASLSLSSLPPPPNVSTTSPCCICLQPPSSPTFRFRPCNCLTCLSCAVNYMLSLSRPPPSYPFHCPSCHKKTLPYPCLSLLLPYPSSFYRLHALFLRQEHIGTLRYCANITCAMPFDWEAGKGRYGGRVECGVCGEITCAKCRDLWHGEKPCGEGESFALRQVANGNGWMECPACGEMIERRRGDCWFVRCRCGVGFCHKCGTAYESLGRIRGNSHGKPGCNCGLFGGEGVRTQHEFKGNIGVNEWVRMAVADAIAGRKGEKGGRVHVGGVECGERLGRVGRRKVREIVKLGKGGQKKQVVRLVWEGEERRMMEGVGKLLGSELEKGYGFRGRMLGGMIGKCIIEEIAGLAQGKWGHEFGDMKWEVVEEVVVRVEEMVGRQEKRSKTEGARGWRVWGKNVRRVEVGLD